MPIPPVVPLDPRGARALQLQRTGPLAEPPQFLFARAHEAFGIRVPLQGVVAGERLGEAQGGTGFHEGDRRRLASVVAHQREPLWV